MAGTEHPARELYQLRFESRKPDAWTHPEKVEDATHATILMRHGPYTTEVLLELPSDDVGRRMALHQRSQVERMIELAFEAGERVAKAKIRRALGITEPRP